MRRCWTLGHVAEARKQWSEQAAQTALGKHVGFDACLHIEEGVQIKYEEAPKKRDIYSIEIRFVFEKNNNFVFALPGTRGSSKRPQFTSNDCLRDQGVSRT